MLYVATDMSGRSITGTEEGLILAATRIGRRMRGPSYEAESVFAFDYLFGPGSSVISVSPAFLDLMTGQHGNVLHPVY